jgi:hypothetical protein
MLKIEELGWSRVEDNLWQFSEGSVVWSSVLFVEQQGWRAVSAMNIDGPYSDIGQAMDAAEEYWKNQDVGPLAKEKASE